MHKIVDGLLRENDGRRVPVTCLPKAADSGWKRWQKPVAMPGPRLDNGHRRCAPPRGQ